VVANSYGRRWHGASGDRPVIIGGVSLFGRSWVNHNAVTGTLVLGVLFNGLVLLNVPSPIQVIIIGAILCRRSNVPTAFFWGRRLRMNSFVKFTSDEKVELLGR